MINDANLLRRRQEGVGFYLLKKNNGTVKENVIKLWSSELWLHWNRLLFDSIE